MLFILKKGENLTRNRGFDFEKPKPRFRVEKDEKEKTNQISNFHNVISHH